MYMIDAIELILALNSRMKAGVGAMELAELEVASGE